jgi:hypothetical protein
LMLTATHNQHGDHQSLNLPVNRLQTNDSAHQVLLINGKS